MLVKWFDAIELQQHHFVSTDHPQAIFFTEENGIEHFTEQAYIIPHSFGRFAGKLKPFRRIVNG